MEIKPRVQGSDKEQVGMGVSGVSLFFSFLFWCCWSEIELRSDWLSIFLFRAKCLCSGLTGCPFSISDQNGSADIDADPVPPLCLRRSPHGSSPTLSDYVRESITFWVEKWTSWSSLSQTVEASPAATEGPSRATFTLGDEPVSQDCRVAGERAPAVAENANFTFVDMQQRVPQSCVAGLHRTSTMPELRTLPCECQWSMPMWWWRAVQGVDLAGTHVPGRGNPQPSLGVGIFILPQAWELSPQTWNCHPRQRIVTQVWESSH